MAQAADCATLSFAPTMSIPHLGGHKATVRSKDPTLAVELNTKAGDANIKSNRRHFVQRCQQIGEAVTNTPLLEAPLKGPVTQSRVSVCFPTWPSFSAVR